jgi:hypothetical protein
LNDVLYNRLNRFRDDRFGDFNDNRLDDIGHDWLSDFLRYRLDNFGNDRFHNFNDNRFDNFFDHRLHDFIDDGIQDWECRGTRTTIPGLRALGAKREGGDDAESDCCGFRQLSHDISPPVPSSRLCGFGPNRVSENSGLRFRPPMGSPSRAEQIRGVHHRPIVN